MKHYGLKQKGTDGWLRDLNNLIFWTTSKAVANEQLKIIISQPSEYEVCEFIDDKENDMARLTDGLGLEIRVAWLINGVAGGGLWFPKEPNIDRLKEVVKQGNADYGCGTHILEERPA